MAEEMNPLEKALERAALFNQQERVSGSPRNPQPKFYPVRGSIKPEPLPLVKPLEGNIIPNSEIHKGYVNIATNDGNENIATVRVDANDLVQALHSELVVHASANTLTIDIGNLSIHLYLGD